MRRRASGILLHLTSLPGPLGMGDMGPAAYRFVDFLVQAHQSVWQILPLGPTSPALGSSPYSSFSAFAGNPLLVSPQRMASDGLLDQRLLQDHMARFEQYGHDLAEFPAAETARMALLEHAYHRGQELVDHPSYRAFLREHAFWVRDYALFTAIKEDQGGRMWTEWPVGLRDRHPDALADAAERLADRVGFHVFAQYLFFSQWKALRTYANLKRVHIIGDAPIYVSMDSADVWSHRTLFKLDADGRPYVVAGVPPDYFSETGQRWGNPVFDWERHAAENFEWWVRRVGQNLALYDYVRIDHFRGFAGYWEIPAAEKTAVNGEWVDAPGMAFFDELAASFPSLPIIAEDLGVITADVRELRDTFNLPGMCILQFAYGDNVGSSIDAPHNHRVNAIAYTGTHDNNTTRGWYEHELSAADRARLEAYLGHAVHAGDVAWNLVRQCMASVARLAMYPMQDLLGLGAEARMNTPALANGNWTWRVHQEAMSDELAEKLAKLTRLFGRA